MTLILVSHALCPYVQRASIALSEKDVVFRRVDIDLSDKPDWFLGLSPLGKTPVLLADDTPIFESAAIVEFLEDTQARPLHPADPLTRAQHRGWMEFASSTLNDIAGLYSAPDQERYAAKASAIEHKIGRLEAAVGDGPFFAGDAFSLVDAAFGPVFRYFDVIEPAVGLDVFGAAECVRRWRQSLAARPSVRDAVGATYAVALTHFLTTRGSHLAKRMAA